MNFRTFFEEVTTDTYIQQIGLDPNDLQQHVKDILTQWFTKNPPNADTIKNLKDLLFAAPHYLQKLANSNYTPQNLEQDINLFLKFRKTVHQIPISFKRIEKLHNLEFPIHKDKCPFPILKGDNIYFKNTDPNPTYDHRLGIVANVQDKGDSFYYTIDFKDEHHEEEKEAYYNGFNGLDNRKEQWKQVVRGEIVVQQRAFEAGEYDAENFLPKGSSLPLLKSPISTSYDHGWFRRVNSLVRSLIHKQLPPSLFTKFTIETVESIAQQLNNGVKLGINGVKQLVNKHLQDFNARIDKWKEIYGPDLDDWRQAEPTLKPIREKLNTLWEPLDTMTEEAQIASQWDKIADAETNFLHEYGIFFGDDNSARDYSLDTASIRAMPEKNYKRADHRRDDLYDMVSRNVSAADFFTNVMPQLYKQWEFVTGYYQTYQAAFEDDN